MFLVKKSYLYKIMIFERHCCVFRLGKYILIVTCIDKYTHSRLYRSFPFGVGVVVIAEDLINTNDSLDLGSFSLQGGVKLNDWNLKWQYTYIVFQH